MRIILSMFFICVYLGISGQNYQPLVIEGNSWSVVNWSWGWAWTDYYFLQGDTVINDTAYKKLYFTADSTLQNDVNYFCGLREDTLSGEVYFNYPYLGDCLLYRFGMDIEETAVVTSLACESIIMTVADIDTITDLMGIERRRMRMEGWFDSYVEYWIEGIGSTLGLLTAGNTYCVADFNQDLLCFNKLGQLIYMNPMYTECHVTMINLRELEAEKNAVKICPNPVTTTSKILINEKIRVERMEIYNSRGLLISEHDPAILKISRGGLEPGLYVLKVITKNSGTINTKFVIN